MLVLVSAKQGTEKSKVVQALCPYRQWFSDDLPLNVDAKQIIERTGGKWIVEAAELNGFRKSDVEHLKAMLSRQVDGPARMAYARLSIEVPRQFILIGTINNKQFLKDSTGNRRFWPVDVRKFDVPAVIRDRDQLWAEAAQREANGESIELKEALWDKAAREQENSQHDDPWEEPLRKALVEGELPAHCQVTESVDNAPDPLRAMLLAGDRYPLDVPWLVLDIPMERRSEMARDRINAIMQNLEFEKKVAKGLGDQRKKPAWRWCRIGADPFEQEVPDDDDEDDREPGQEG